MTTQRYSNGIKVVVATKLANLQNLRWEFILDYWSSLIIITRVLKSGRGRQN